ncbi:hypothetical protein JAAARDRAFT_593478 [Jaapia argillacea MUCL 33604]|uniref:RNA helicase n=1 Tax=Jaapia argillacea MUCL 33604 TaxID=933084 RepID=A0A067Q935_9AGAM|nr:hypothetical protein JAAARDRAFT_593478 [Jaapia argillacea MUCL 33604]
MVVCACGVSLKIHDMEAHLKGRRHKELLARENATSTGRKLSNGPVSGPPSKVPAPSTSRKDPAPTPSHNGSSPSPSWARPQRNRAQPRAPASSYRCEICQIRLDNLEGYLRHVESLQHRQTVTRASAPVGDKDAPPRGVFCIFCETNVPTHTFASHRQSPAHVEKERVAAMRAEVEEAASDKKGISISPPDGSVDFGVLEIDETLGSSVTQSVVMIISNTQSTGRVALTEIRLASSARKNSRGVSFSATLVGKSQSIEQSSTRSALVLFHPSYEGRYEDTVEFLFHDTRGDERFVITRRVTAIVGSEEDYDLLKPSAPYAKPIVRPLEPEELVIPGLRPPTWSDVRFRNPLPEYPPPKDLIDAAYGRNGWKEVKSRFLPRIFDVISHAKWFQVLLHIEEEKQRRNLDRYSQSGVELRPDYPRYSLKVKGLLEKRPSIIVGDTILAKRTDTDGPWFEGCVHAVRGDTISLRFGDEFNTYRGKIFDVRFKLNRMPLRRMHQALLAWGAAPRLTFPGPEHASYGLVDPMLVDAIQAQLVNRTIAQDKEQLCAIAAIVNQPRGSAPFIIFGPPGTGKTVTLVEAIRQLLADPDARILACAPSNLAADTIALRLKDIGPSQLFRMNALSRALNDLMNISPTLKPFCQINGNSVFAIPPIEDLLRFRVIVSTCVSGGIPHGVGLKRGHFTHIFVDEAGQASEPEVMIPIKSMAGDHTNVVLAGDIKQLGPIIHSTISPEFGLSRSYLERLMARNIYNLHERMGITVVKLLSQHRSHPSIIEFSNETFYDNELRPCGDHVITHSLLSSGVLVKKGFPVVFHGITGRDLREETSPSFFNIEEATVVKRYCEDLLDEHKSLKPEHIGIISPYHAQCVKITNILQKKYKDIKVGSVEEFQGQERRVIILSTVRSNLNFVKQDIRQTLGFVANKRRLNVAITRAQALLIIVGDPVVLSLDPTWRAFLNLIHKNGGCRGKEIDWDGNEAVDYDGGVAAYAQQRRTTAMKDMEEMIVRLRAHVAARTNDSVPFQEPDSDVESDGDAYEDTPWREYD